ncbi:hypothetical protein OG21DRAFT_643070 [Imleria badia]|nr:hypothetical protein OG21DRAFT_643070 [Imleria badia]
MDPVTDTPASGKKKGLLIAVEDNMVKGYAKLYHAHRDAKDVRRLLTEDFGYSAEDIVLMMDHKSIPKDLWPTKTRIRKQIQRFVQGVSTGDHLFFYYSGHGHQVPCHHHTEPDGLDEEIYTCNGKEIIDNDLKKWLVEPLPPGCKLFVHCGIHVIPKRYLTLTTTLATNQEVSNVCDSVKILLFVQHFGERFRRNVLAPIPRSAITIAHELRGRPVARASVSITAVSAGNSPPLSKWTPFSTDVQRVLSPLSWLNLKCNGRCSLPSEADPRLAHVISLSACKDNESAFDDACNGTFTKFFIDHLRAKPKSTLRDLLLAIRQRVDEITAARQAWDEEMRVISRQCTFASNRRVKTEWTPQVVRRNTEVNVSTVDELSLFTPSSAQEGDVNKYSQKPSVSSL